MTKVLKAGISTWKKTSIGLGANIAGLLCYLLGWVSGIIFILIERENKFVRFHAMQSIIVFGIITLCSIIFDWIPFVGDFINMIVCVIGFILWIVLMVMAVEGRRYKLPWAGDLAEKHT